MLNSVGDTRGYQIVVLKAAHSSFQGKIKTKQNLYSSIIITPQTSSRLYSINDTQTIVKVTSTTTFTIQITIVRINISINFYKTSVYSIYPFHGNHMMSRKSYLLLFICLSSVFAISSDKHFIADGTYNGLNTFDLGTRDDECPPWYVVFYHIFPFFLY